MRRILFSICALIALVSCQQKEDYTLPSVGQEMTFYASIMDETTKTTAEVDGNQTKVLWAAGDAYGAFVKGGALAKFTLSDGEGTVKASFTGTAETGSAANTVAYYPYAEGITYAENKLNVVIPAVQTYTAGSIAAAPMVAVSETNELVFKNVASLLKVTLTGDRTIKSVTLSGNNNEVLAGNAVVDLSGETPVLALAAGATDKSIKLDCGDGIALTEQGVDFYFAVPAITLTKGFTIVAVDTEDKAMTKSTANEVVLAASKVKVMEAFAYDGVADASEAELKAAILSAAAGSTVTLGSSVNISSALVITKDLTIDLNGKTLTSAGDGFEVTAGTLTITGDGTVNAGTEGGSWVAVWANGGNAVIENGTYSVVAGTNGSTNDCIYAKGGQITINGGTFSNVGTYVPNMGGVVINANNTVANSKVIINGGTFNPAAGCVPYEVADVEAGRIELNNVANESELKIAVAAGKNVKLGADIQISSAVLVTKDLTIDLNEKTLTSAGDGFEVTAGTLTITGNGTVKAGTEGGSWVAVWANGGNAVIQNGTYSVVAGTNGSTNDCIYAKGGLITINGGTFSNAGTYVANMGGVVINANNTVADSKVIINGGTFNPAEGCVAYEQADVDAGRVVINNQQ